MFVATVGDNFYWTGASPSKWQNIWVNEYGNQNESSPLYNIPWLASRGNHDFGNDDPYAFCPNVHPFANYEG